MWVNQSLPTRAKSSRNEESHSFVHLSSIFSHPLLLSLIRSKALLSTCNELGRLSINCVTMGESHFAFRFSTWTDVVSLKSSPVLTFLLTTGDFFTPSRISKLVKDLQAGFSLLNLKNDSLRRRFDALKVSWTRSDSWKKTARTLKEFLNPISTSHTYTVRCQKDRGSRLWLVSEKTDSRECLGWWSGFPSNVE